MKYKLIKEYPGSPKLGNTIDNLENDWIENYPEFWEKIVEKDYEILSLKSIHSTTVIDYKNGGGSYIKGKFEAVYKSKDKWVKSFLTSGVWVIHSVKRLSDGEIFTIGDKVVGYNNSIAKIKTIYLIGEISLNIGTDKHEGFSLKNLKKVKQPLFTTEDGVDIFENNTGIYILDKFTIRHIKHKDFNVISKHVKYFSTKEKAEEYILLNKPCLSLNDLKQFFPDTYIPFKKGESATEDVNTKQLEDLVKSKIQQSV